MRPVYRRYLREFIPAMTGYMLVIFATTWLLRHYGAVLGLGARAALALLPMLPIALVMRAIVRVIRDSDELERRIELEAVAVAALAVGTGFFSLGLLLGAQLMSVAADTVAIWVLPSLCAIYGIAKCIAVRRYR